MSKAKSSAVAAATPEAGSRAGYQSAAVQIKFGSKARLAARVDVTPTGLLAIGGWYR